MSEKHTCCARVYHQALWRGHPCGHKAKVEREGKWYCGIHDPERLAAKRRETKERWSAASRAQKDRAVRAQRLTAAREAVVEAAKRLHQAQTHMQRMAIVDEFDAAVARLLEVESEHG